MTLVSITRHPGKPTSGRYVYKACDGSWYWQCDLHPDESPDHYGLDYFTADGALAGALAHAKVCPFRAAPLSHHLPPEKEEA